MDDPVTPKCSIKRDRPKSSEESIDLVIDKISELRKKSVTKKCRFDEGEMIELILVDDENKQKNLTLDNTSNPVNTNDTNKKIKIILNNHGIKKENIKKEYFNTNIVKNFNILEIKESFRDKKTLIGYIHVKDIEFAIEKKNWTIIEKDFNIIIDKKSSLVKSLCINKTRGHRPEGQRRVTESIYYKKDKR